MQKINLILGYNGEGKTNLIDAVHYLCFGKSYFSSTDKKILKWDESFFRIEGLIRQEALDFKIKTKVIPGKLKEIEINGKKVPKMAEMIGRFPVIAIAPKEIYSLLLASESRRKIIDQVISQFDRAYLQSLIQYNAIISRRNALLKQAERFNHLDLTLIEMLNNQLIEPANHIYETRLAFAKELIPIFESSYQIICSEKELGTVNYKSQLIENDYKTLLDQNIEKDFHLNRTASGIHKDDFEFLLNDHPLNAYGSQGQMKTYVIALKIALFKLLSKHRNIQPILLMDDIFDKFDKNRTAALIELIFSDGFGQVFITDADKTRIAKILDELNIPYGMFIVEKGNII